MRRRLKKFMIMMAFTLVLTTLLGYFTYASNAISVQEAISKNDGKTIATVEGYIVGTANNDIKNNKAMYFLIPPFNNQQNIVLADDFNEVDEEKLLPVRFDFINETLAATLNLVDNPTHHRKKVEITGKLDNYFFVPGLRNPSHFEWVPLSIQHTPPLHPIGVQEEILLSFTATGGKGTVTASVYYKTEKKPSFSLLSENKGDEVIIPATEVLGDLEYYIVFQDEETALRLPEEGKLYKIVVTKEEPIEEPQNPEEVEEPEEPEEPENPEIPQNPQENPIEEIEEGEKEKESENHQNNDETDENHKGYQKEDKGQGDNAGKIETIYKKIGNNPVEELQRTLEDIPIIGLLDIHQHWAEEYILLLSKAGIISGYPGGIFLPDHSITRGEFITLLVKALGLNLKEQEKDRKSLDHWAADYIAVAIKEGILEEAVEIINIIDECPTGEEVILLLSRMIPLDHISNYNWLYGKEEVSRGEAAVIIFNIYF